MTALVGSMVGVGIFGIPFAFAKAGFIIGAGLLFFIAAETILVDLMYGEVVLRTHAKHQLVGYTKKYLGGLAQKTVFLAAVLTGYAALLAYIIVAGDFLHVLLSQFFYVPLSVYSLLFFAAVSVGVLRGLKTVSWLEMVFCGFFIFIIGLFFSTGVRHIQPTNFLGHAAQFSYLPYGVLLFAFGGLLAIPIQRELLVGQERKLRRAIICAILGAGVLYAIFTVTVIGVSGSATSADSISGLYQFLGAPITIIGALFGIAAITTSFLMLSSAMIEVFHFDFRLRRFKSWLLVIGPPLVFFLTGFRAFVDVIALAGGVALGIEKIIVVLVYARAKSQGDRVPEYSLNIPNWLLYVIMAVFAAGIGYYLILK